MLWNGPLIQDYDDNFFALLAPCLVLMSPSRSRRSFVASACAVPPRHTQETRLGHIHLLRPLPCHMQEHIRAQILLPRPALSRRHGHMNVPTPPQPVSMPDYLKHTSTDEVRILSVCSMLQADLRTKVIHTTRIHSSYHDPVHTKYRDECANLKQRIIGELDPLHAEWDQRRYAGAPYRCQRQGRYGSDDLWASVRGRRRPHLGCW
jgi:hypothetical protein